MRVFTAALGFVFAIYVLSLEAISPPHDLAPLIIASYFLVPLAMGLLAGWWALLLAAMTFVAARVAYQVAVWHDDPQLAGIDDIPPLAGIVLVLPWVLLLVAFGAALRQHVRRRSRR